MARVRITPFVVAAALVALAVLGARGRAYNVPEHVVCAYALAERAAPPADVLIIGSSRVGKGLDPGYMEARIRAATGRDITIERLALTFPTVPQFRPLVDRYLAVRGAPKHAIVQLFYNFKPDRQRGWDLPIHSIRNVAYADMAELVEIQKTAVLNDYGTILSRRFEADYVQMAVLALEKFEADIYSGLRWPGQKLLGKLDRCSGDRLYSQANRNWHYNRLTDGLSFSENDRRWRLRRANEAEAASFLPLAPAAPWRRFETDQFLRLIGSLEAAGSTVHLMLMPALGDTSLTVAEEAEIRAVFGDRDLIHPYALFAGPEGANLARAYADTHHATPYGALLYSRYFADVISGFDR